MFTGGDRWLAIPHLPKFQPSEIAKVALMVFLARSIAVNHDQIEEKRTFYWLLVPVAVTCGLIVKENLSTAILIWVSCYLLIFFGGVNKSMWWKGVAVMAIAAVVMFVVLYFVGDKMDVARSGTWGHRLQNWLHPNPDELSQENMARMAVARGEFFGCGIGSTIHGRLMTQAHNDFIYAIIIEEAGMLAAIAIFALYVLFYFRCIHIARHCKGTFGSLSVAGLSTMIFLQALVNMSVAVGVLPVTGQTLPFISFGGTAYLFMGFGVGHTRFLSSEFTRKKRS